MKTTIYLFRHGQTEWNQQKKMQGWQNSKLTTEGKRQADLLGKKLKQDKADIHVLYVSPSQRAIETAHLINQNLNLEIITDDGFQEINMGNWEGKTYEEIEEKYPEDWQHFWQSPEQFRAENGGETFEELTKRSTESLMNLLSLHKGETIGVISHRITIKCLVAYLLEIPISELADIKPNSLTKLSIENNKIELDILSDITHYTKQ